MIWSKLVSWVIIRGVVSGAILGALFGALLLFIYGALIGSVLGALLGAAIGLVNGLLLTTPTMRLRNSRISPNIIYLFAPLTNALPVFILLGVSIGTIPALLSGIAAAYFCGGYLEYADSLLKDIPSRKPTVNVLS